MVTANKRLFYALYSMGIAYDGSTSYTTVHGQQAVGLTTRFSLDHIFELGQLFEYQAVENIPDVEITTEKVIDGAPLVYHLATQRGTDGTLLGRGNVKCAVAINYFADSQQNASGVPLNQVTCSGVFPSSLTYTFPVQGNCTESLTLIGNNKTWLTAGFTFSGTSTFDGTDVPPSGVKKRQNITMGSGYTKLPADIPGVTLFGTNGYNMLGSDGQYGVHVQSIRASTNLGRTPLFELGRKAPYFRTADFPVEVRCDIEVMDQKGDSVQCLEEATNLTPRTIRVNVDEGSLFDLGAKNYLTSVAETGGNAGVGGGNRTIVFSYVNYNTLTVSSPYDPGSF